MCGTHLRMELNRPECFTHSIGLDWRVIVGSKQDRSGWNGRNRILMGLNNLESLGKAFEKWIQGSLRSQTDLAVAQLPPLRIELNFPPRAEAIS